MSTVASTGQRRVRGAQEPPRINVIALFLLVTSALAGLALSITQKQDVPWYFFAGLGLGLAASLSPKVAKQWERAVVLRLGKYVGLRGPGLFWIVPGIDQVSTWLDQRTITTSFAAEETLTSDTVPVNVDAVLFWMVYDPEKAALEVQDYKIAVSWAAQTALRDIIGRTPLTVLLRGREQIEAELQKLIDDRSTPWGVTVHSVEMRDVVIPESLQDAMSREAQASREKEARIILGQAEVEIAHLFQQASHCYEGNATALHLRAMNILYEGLKEKGALMLVPSTAVESMGLGGLLGAAALRQQTLSQTESEQASSQTADNNGPPRRSSGPGIAEIHVPVV
jgi:regulator of protease activity HflC (stomatin/prohibitin superfamily)